MEMPVTKVGALCEKKKLETTGGGREVGVAVYLA